VRAVDTVQRRTTVLLADDNDDLRWLARVFLEKVGLTVLESGDGDHAARLAQKSAGQIDLLITDLRMPGMDGRHLARHFRTLNPGAAVLFISGEEVKEVNCASLSKPFSVTQLVEAAQHLLRTVVV
jgi:CheY-like chemotaxis protein